MILRLILKSFATLLAAFLLIEVYYQLNYRAGSALPHFFRVYDYRYIDQDGTPRLPPNLVAWHKSYSGRPDVKIHINSQQFRGNELLQTPSTRIAMIGDSMVFNGAVELEESFPFLTEAYLRSELEDRNIEVINAGVGDINARQYHLKLKNHVLAYRPNLVVVFMYLNDSIETPLTSFDTSSRSIAIPWYHSFAAENIYKLFSNINLLYRAQQSGRFGWVEMFTSKKYLRDQAAWGKMLDDARFDWGAAWNVKNWEVIESAMGAMSNISASHGIEIWMVVLPTKPQLELPESTPELTLPQEFGRNVADHLNVKYLDPLPYLRSLNDADNLIYDQCHFTARGNEAMAKFLTTYLEEWIGARRNAPALAAAEIG